MNNSPAFSVVIPLYNKESTIDRAVRSVLDQSVQDFEIVVVNDGSTDRGAAMVEQTTDTRIRLISQDNRGVSAARNRGVSESKAEFIAFLDADDFWEPGFLEEISALRDSYPGCGIYATGYSFCRGEDKWPAIIRLRRNLGEEGRGLLGDYFNVACVSHPPVCSSAACVPKKTLVEVGGFPAGVTSGEDLLTWARLAVSYPVAYSTRSLSTFWLGDPADAKDGLRRLPDAHDHVGRELRNLLPLCPLNQRSALRRYIAHWYKMRASVFIRVPGLRRAFSAWLLSFGFHAMQPRLWFYLPLIVAPHRLRTKIIDSFLRRP